MREKLPKSLVFIGAILVMLSMFKVNMIYAAGGESSSMYLSPSTGTYDTSEEFSVDIMVDPDGADISAAQASVSYDDAVLQVISVELGSVLSSEATNSYGSGEIDLSVFHTADTLSSIGSIGTITFRGIESGDTDVSILFTADSDTQSGIYEAGSDTNLLSSVSSGSYTIGSGSGSNSDDSDDEEEELPDTSRNGILNVGIGVSGLILILFGIIGYRGNLVFDLFWKGGELDEISKQLDR